MTLSGLRAAVATVKNGLSGSQVVATVAAPGFSVLTPPIVMAVGNSTLKSGVVNNGIPCNGSPLPDTLDFQSFVDAGTSSSAIRVTEAIPGALAPKTSSTTIGTRI